MNDLEGILVSRKIGIGDAIQFTTVPENYYRHYSRPIVDTERNWVFDYNPYVVRGVQPKKTHDVWNDILLDVPKEKLGRTIMLCLAEAPLKSFDYPIVMNRPRLYKFEHTPFSARTKIIVHVKGRSHGQMPEHIIKHIIEKYGDQDLWLLARPGEWDYPFTWPGKVFNATPEIWKSVEFIADAKMFIGLDSGPAWIAQCYPDIIVKKVRLIPELDRLKNWVPLEWCMLGSYWDDRSGFIYNPSSDDVGFTWSYKRI